MKTSTFLAAFFMLASLTGLAVAQEQKILFCSDSISYNNKFGQLECQAMCKKYSDSQCLKKELNQGWVIGSTSPKEVNENPPEWGKCACVGTQYVLTKAPPKPAENAPDPAATQRVTLLEKEIELLKNL